ncbi:MAG TPA: flagellar basal-body rod protein FlgF [Candidatus Baltobacteraceae bacterium]|nr:flagellar basal-body rod protein FlgF [Candidatus Baltobacteraceae bacterium]
MVRGLYTAASGALVAQSQADTIANNLANVNTSGFKRTLLQVQSAPEMGVYRRQIDAGNPHGTSSSAFVGALGMGAQVMDTPAVFEQGTLGQTGNPLDLAIQGSAFFAIQTPQGVRYTRDGQFSEDPTGRLVTPDGSLVLGTNGPVQLQPGGGAIQIDQNGQITQGGRAIDTIALVTFGNPAQVRPEGDNRFIASNAALPARAAGGSTIHQGFLERSNANVVRSMVDLISAQRWFEANQKVIQTQDEANGWAIENVAKSQR